MAHLRGDSLIQLFLFLFSECVEGEESCPALSTLALFTAASALIRYGFIEHFFFQLHHAASGILSSNFAGIEPISSLQ